ncbi:MAG: TetR/AcrR family transcriptional regulator [Bacteroidetes bacterium]|nr:TetR/AcrR family transcriptional regulator [Bacteroidota bacterium]
MGIAERKEREKQQRKEEIIEAAEQVFFSKGFEQSTMDDIAMKAELSKGTLYLYFKSKEDLHMAVARRAIILLRSITLKATEQAGNAIEKLQRMGWACIEFSGSNPDHMKAIMTLEGMETASISYTTSDVQNLIYNESTVGTVIQVVEQGVAEKIIRSDIPAALVAHTLWMTVLSVIRFVSMKKELFKMLELSPAKIFESHFELVLNGIRS